MVQVVCGLEPGDALTVLLRSAETIFTAATDPACKPDTHKSANEYGRISLGKSVSECNDSSNAFMATNMWKFNVRDRLAVRPSCGALTSVQVGLANPAIQNFGENFVLARSLDGIVGHEFHGPTECPDESHRLLVWDRDWSHEGERRMEKMDKALR